MTTNKGKAKEVRKILKGFRVAVKAIELPEDHFLSQEKIAAAKARAAFEIVGKPVVVDDTGFFVDGFKNFPGVRSKAVFKKLGLKGFIKKCGGRKAYALTIAAFFDGKKLILFKGVSRGRISKASSKRLIEGLPYLSCFIPEGSKEIVVNLPEKKIHEFLVEENHRAKAFKKFGKWFSHR